MESLTLKQAKLPIEKFNTTIKIQLEQLRAHKWTISKLLRQNASIGSYDKIKIEELNAIRLIKQMKTLIVAMSELRSQILERERDEFDARIPLKDEALKEIQSFLGKQNCVTHTKVIKFFVSLLAMELRPPETIQPYYEEDSVNVDELQPIQACFQLNEYQLKARTAMLNEVVQLEKDFQDMLGIYKQVQTMVHEQGESINQVERNIESTQIAVAEGTQHLRTALKYQKAAYPLLGAVIGTCVLGPFGLIAGMKTGTLLALGGGMLGYTGGKVLKKDVNSSEQEPEIATQAIDSSKP